MCRSSHLFTYSGPMIMSDKSKVKSDGLGKKTSGAKLVDSVSKDVGIGKKQDLVLNIGLDSEYQFNGIFNEVLSYQYAVEHDGKTLGGIFYPEDGYVGSRLTLEQYLSRVVQECIDNGILVGRQKWPDRIVVYAHFLRADIVTFGDFFSIKDKFSSIRGTVQSESSMTIGIDGGYGIDESEVLKKRFHQKLLNLRDLSRNIHEVSVKFVDTMTLTPGGKGLSECGRMIGLPKLEIPEEYSIERMREYLESDREGFEKYAIRDAEIACRYGLKINQVVKDELGINKNIFSLAHAGVECFKGLLAKEEFDLLDVFGKSKSTYTIWREIDG